MKKFISVAAAFVLLLSTQIAARDIVIKVDGAVVEANPAPFIENSRTLVPIRFVSEALGYKVDWNESDRKVTIEKEPVSIELTVDSQDVKVKRGEKTEAHKLDVAPSIRSDRTFVPVRFISETMGLKVDWEDSTSTISIASDKNVNLTDEEAAFVREFDQLQGEVAKKTSDLKDVFFKNADSYSKEEAIAKLDEYEREFDALVEKARNMNVPEKFKDSHAQFVDNIGALKVIVNNYKEAFLNGSKSAATDAISKLSDFSIRMTEVKDKLNAAAQGIEYKAREDIKRYNEIKDANETKNLTSDPTIKNMLDSIGK